MPDSSRVSQPLAGIRVLEFGQAIAAPTCGRYLSALGAEVIKIENLMAPDLIRAAAPSWVPADVSPLLKFDMPPIGAEFVSGKMSCGLNISTPRGRELLEKLAAIRVQRQHGEGDLIDVSLQQAVLTASGEAGASAFLDDAELRTRVGSRRALAGPMGHFRTLDGFASIIAIMPAHWEAFATWVVERTGQKESSTSP